MQGAANLSSLNRLVVRTYDSLGMQASQRIKHLNLTDLQATTNEYPCLKHVKGAKIRWFTPVCLEICKMYATTKEGKHRKACVQALHEMYLLLQKDWKEWGPACGAAFTKHGEDMLSHYSWLAGASADAGKHMWSMVQKHHVLNHLLEQSMHLHPAGVWCYGSEGFMSISVHIAGSCVKGTPSHKVPSKILQTMRFAFHLLLKGYLSLEEQAPAGED